jgi:hypothetical protein
MGDVLTTSAPMRLLDLSGTDVLLAMCLAFALCVILARVCAATAPAGTQTRHVPRTMVLLGVTVSLIMAVIGNSLARAFGAIGALSLIRFRTAVKDPRDLAHIFMSIALGMASGSGYFRIAIGAAALMCLFLLFLSRFPLAESGLRFCLLRLRHAPELDVPGQVLPLVRRLARDVKVLGKEAAAEGKGFETVIELAVDEAQPLEDLIRELTKTHPTVQVSVLLD